VANSEHQFPERAATRRRGVLVVEDEILLRLAIAGYLRGAGCAVFEAGTAAEAVEVIESGESVGIVFTDVQMPGPMDGLMLACWVHEHHPGVQVLVTSGKGDAAVPYQFIPEESFFAKPYPLETVANRILLLLENDGAR
jgi:DNA-binding NtrC family response regulator